ncbi:hypothetical protein IMCC20628_04884 (plasmid) [Hoeflea sp. IMCC20628]|uniref:hypothetical protein n=1 Tax=Hoeflea sp. IMCC20628 TaxID=1620421 RepID=UPI00063BE69B|nr:hypothetical protein [Hoeflea sp. IMCC20628]AKI03548.1 hypothetical protein IMCC20628_04884 [Hoeflea sp. IMCC20628]
MTLPATLAQPTSYQHTTDLKALQPQLEALVTEITASALSVEAMRQSFSASLEEAASVLRSVPVHEGRLLERGIDLLAACNPDLVVLTENIRLPLTPTAMQLVEHNEVHLYRGLTLDADTGGRKSYTPDHLIINRLTGIAHMVDVKRSLTSYEASRIADLKNRMLASALVVPDHVYKGHHRLLVKEVRVVILNAHGGRTDIKGGIWPLSHLDHLLEVTGAGEVLLSLRKLFRERIDANWVAARSPITASGIDSSASTTALQDVAVDAGDEDGSVKRLTDAGDEDAVALEDLPPVIVGFAQVPAAGPH